MKCPFCETELEQGIELLRGGHILGCPKCKRNADDIFWFAMIKAKQDLEFFIGEHDKSSTALVERTKELDKCQKNLETARKALDEIAYGTLPYPEVMARETLELIEHKA